MSNRHNNGNPRIAKWMADEIDRAVLEKMSRMNGDVPVEERGTSSPPEWILKLKEYSMYLPPANLATSVENILESDRNSAGIWSK